MSGWLTTAKNVFRRKNEPPPQTFEIRCGCGKSVSGERLRTEQTTVCAACKTPLFVLPASVYPLPRAPAPKKIVRAARPAADHATTSTASKTTTEPAGVGRLKRRSPASAMEVAEPTNPPQPALGERLRQALEPENLDRLRRRLLTPLRMVLLGVALVIVGTVWWVSHLRALDRARIVLANVPRLAEELLQEGDAPEAARQFALLRNAVDLLGRDDAQSHRWRQLARETAVISDLATATLHDILREAAETADGPGAGTWTHIFRANYRDGWVLIDAPVSLEPQSSANPRYTVDFPLTAGEHRGKLIAELPALGEAVSADGSARRVIFAAQLANCRVESDADPVWRIELRPDTGFLWSGVETYRMLGMPADDDSLKTLAAQSQLLGIEP